VEPIEVLTEEDQWKRGEKPPPPVNEEMQSDFITFPTFAEDEEDEMDED
jgi:hypothetical protein